MRQRPGRVRPVLRAALVTAAALATATALAKSPAPHGMAMPPNTPMSDARMAQIMGSEHMMSAPLGSPGSVALSVYAANDPLPPPDNFDIGTLTRDIGAKDGMVRKWFNRGLRYFYAFNHRESYRAFRYALMRDPDCVMCAWGEAMSLGVNINQLDQPEADRALAEKILTAAATVKDPKAEETLLVVALKKRYEADGGAQSTRNRNYARAMLDLYKRYADDPEVEVATADAVMNIQPWKYWTIDGTPAFPEVTIARDALERGLKARPSHMGLVHWYIHLMEGSRTPELALPYARTLPKLAPDAGHLNHMPSHIYYRVGDQVASVEANRDAIGKDRDYFAKVPLSHPEGDRYRWGYFRHNIHFMLSSAILTGRGNDIRDAASWLLQSEDRNIVFRTDRYRGIYYQAVVYAMRPEEIVKLPPPPSGNGWRFAQASYAYAQALAFIRLGKPESVAQAQKALVDAMNAFRKEEPDDVDNFKALQIADAVVEARRREHFRVGGDPMMPINAAVAIRNAMDYDEPPFWMVSPLQTRAAIEIAARRYQAAIDDIHESFGRGAKGNPTLGYRGNAWGYYALIVAYSQKGALTPAEQADQADAKEQYARICGSQPLCVASSLDTM